MSGKDDDVLVYEVPEAGAKLGLSRSRSYQAAQRGEIPTIRIGKLWKVPKAAFDQMLSVPVTKGEAA
jgi:excisionase family DNA binding protein